MPERQADEMRSVECGVVVVVKCGKLKLARALLPGSWLRPEGSRSDPPYTTCDTCSLKSSTVLTFSHMMHMQISPTSAIRSWYVNAKLHAIPSTSFYHSPQVSSSFFAAPLPPDGFIALVPSVVGFVFCCCATVPAAAKSSQKSFFSWGGPAGS